ncbi:26S proteasome regulatory subunit N9 [Fistulifera solaris]|uniref:26S proteasome regulatory subunit N9 n=1 Tax=Fistulifera solaris TaxID=1519565 RepID=A0A1Z5J9R3_FISSO|nr:26S proteasome regulatory subunit N9 [Fistulifera solaris]|eukprot:GAX10725.1 26S proteasome regulatory subunit N9 [Fistulifera solaris]
MTSSSKEALAIEYCESMAQLHPDLAADYYQPMQSFLATKRWHQLTLKILEFVHDTRNIRQTVHDDNGHSFLTLYDQVVQSVDAKLHPLSLARIAAAVAGALAEHDLTAAKAVLENVIANKKVINAVATIFAQSKHSLLCLQSLPPENTPQRKEALDAILSVIRSNATTLNELLISDPVDQAIVNAAHLEQAMMYYKIVGPAEAFYEQAIQFLHYAPSPGPTSSSRSSSSSSTGVNYHQLAVDLCLAALTADGVYNLGQVLESAPKQLILSLKDSPEGWLVDILRACADGDLTQFRQLTEQHAEAIQQQPALVHRATAVQEKLTLLALVKMIFAKPAHERTLAFSEIAEQLMVPEDQVEWIIMRALSVKLIKGSIDQVDRTLQVTWVLPRVLNQEQLVSLAGRYGEWAAKVGRIQEKIQDQTVTFA